MIGVVYKLVCDDTKAMYIGSTFKGVQVRLRFHADSYKKFSSADPKSTRYTTSFEIIKGQKYHIEIVEQFECDVHELRRRECDYIKQFRAEGFNVVNKNLPGRSMRQYYQDHKERLVQKQREYDGEHREQILARMKEYYRKKKNMS